ncbi:MAG TPA: hypothetical protein VHS53_01975 [Mucilaginibacter sp.]|nr:hypothetical protein [Mucilaginibacter sp.]
MCDRKFPRENANGKGQCRKEQNRGIYYHMQLVNLIKKLTCSHPQNLNYAWLPVSRN